MGQQSSSISKFPQSVADNTMSSISVITTRRDTTVLSITPYVSQEKTRKLSVSNVRNGVTGTFISGKICKIAASFWLNNVDSLSMNDRLELGCSIFFHMMSSDRKIRKFMKLNRKQSIEKTSIKYLDMMGWLIRYLIADNVDLFSLLQKLGVIHRQLKITIHHFDVMLDAMHECFAHYFKNKYTVDVKYAMDEIFSLAAQVMTEQNIRYSPHLLKITKQFEQKKIPFLQSLNVCLESPIGNEYLFRYLSQTWCNEIVIFLKSFNRFKHLMTDKERFFVAREITKHSIDPIAAFALNLSYETRNNALQKMAQLETQFAINDTIEVSPNLYDEVEHEILLLILDNHWNAFVKDIESLQCKSLESQQKK